MSGDLTDFDSFGIRLAGRLGVRESGRALRDFATYLPSQALPALAGLIALPIIARRLTPTELGVLAIAQTLVTLGWVISSQWMTTAVMRELPAARQAHQLGRFVRTLQTACGVCAALLVAYCSVVAVAAAFSGAVAETFWYIVAGTAGFSIHAIATTLFAAELRPTAYAIADVSARAGGIALGVALVFHGSGLHGYLFALALALLAVGAVGLASAWPRGSRAEGPPQVSQWLRYGLPVTASAAALWLLLLVDRYLLALLKNTAAVGVYSVGNVIGDKAVALPTFAFFIAARPLLVRAFERGGRAELERLMREYTRVIVLIGVPAVALAVTTASPLVPLLTGSRNYDAAIAVVPIVAFGSFVLALTLVGNAGLVIARRTMPLVYAALAGLAANVAANLALIPPLGVKGAAIATPIGNAVFLLTAQWWARRDATWRFPFRTFLLAALAGASAVAAGVAARSVAGGRLPDVLLAATATAVVYLAVVAVLRRRLSPA